VPAGGCDLQTLLDMLPAAGEPESIEFDRELRRVLFQRASERVRGEVHQTSWDAFWETAVMGKSAAETASKLGMSVEAVRVAKCRVLARLPAVVAEW
jgi:RNA polymerase sigma-70 factor (ECF subfamily)